MMSFDAMKASPHGGSIQVISILCVFGTCVCSKWHLQPQGEKQVE